MIQDTTDNDDDLLKSQVIQYPQTSDIINFKNDSLEKLSIYNSLSQSVPTAIDLENILTLNLSHSNLKHLPDNLSALKNLELLNLSDNELFDLPYSYSNLKRLQELNISSNKFETIPKCILHGMGTLKILNISKNPQIKMNVIPCSKYLEKFYSSDNQNCGKFPDWILSSKFFNIREFNFNKTRFDLFSFVGLNNEIHLESISMACSNLSNTVLSMMLKNVVHLEKINVGNENLGNNGNLFNSIPLDILKNPMTITEMNFRGTDLPSIPVSINRLYNLKKLDLGCNNISWFPEEVCELQKLESLKFDENNFLMLPKNIGKLISLKELRAEKNSISSLPETFKDLINLEICDLYDNLLEEFPKVLLKISSLQCLDLEMNHFWTDDTLEKSTYLSLKKNFVSLMKKNGENTDRTNGAKLEPIESDVTEKETNYDDSRATSGSESEQFDPNDYDDKSTEENWDANSDSDDSFEPGGPQQIHYIPKSNKFIQPEPLGFCPADLHSQRIRREVASMRACGSLASLKTEEGQFDDV